MTRSQGKRCKAWMAWGLHGGYGLNGQRKTALAIRKMAEQAGVFPQTVFSMEFEPYALDRMANGARLKMERARKGARFKDHVSLDIFRDLVRRGRLQIVSTYTQPLLFHCDEESVVRQFAEAKRIVRETLGLEMDSYWAQEPCWCGQLPGILRQFGIPYCYFSNAWTAFGTAPMRNAGKVRWRGPDGSMVWTIPRTPYATAWKEDVEYGREPHTYWSRSDEPAAYHLKWALLSGHGVPVFGSLASDYYETRSMTPYERVAADIDLQCATIPHLMRKLRNDGIWDDAYGEFRDQFPWGLKGGSAMLAAQRASNRANGWARLAAITGDGAADTVRDLWELAMLAQHHDMQVLCAKWPHPQFGVPYGQVPENCDAESAGRVATLKRLPRRRVFSVVNPTQAPRCEWIQVAFAPARGALRASHVEVVGVPSRLTVRERHSDGSVKRIEGAFLANVPSFGVSRYTLLPAEKGAPFTVPIEVKANARRVKIVSGSVTLTLTRNSAVLERGAYRVCKNIRLAADVDGKPEVSRFENIGGEATPDGRAVAWAEGFVGSLPVKVTFTLSPWSRRMDIEVSCHVEGQRIEGRRHDDIKGSLRAVLEHGRPSVYRCHQPFELRKPQGSRSCAVQFFVTEWRDTAGGFVCVLDRPSGLLLNELEAGVALCHRGKYEYGDMLPTGERIDDTSGVFTYRLAVIPFYAHELGDALQESQRQAYPLALIAPVENNLGIRVEGHSIVSALCVEADGTVILRVWNPLVTDRFRIEAPGYELARSRFDGSKRTAWKRDSIRVRIEPMQFTQFVLRRRRSRS